MTNVLSAVEYTKCKSSQKIPRSQVTGDGSETKSGPAFEKKIDVLELRNVVFPVTAILD